MYCPQIERGRGPAPCVRGCSGYFLPQAKSLSGKPDPALPGHALTIMLFVFTWSQHHVFPKCFVSCLKKSQLRSSTI